MSDPNRQMELIIKSPAGKASKNDWDGALKDYREAIRIAPGSALAHMKAGECCVKVGKTREAVTYLLSAARKYAEEGSTARAVAIYSSILKIEPNAHGVQDELARLRG